jgi:hypothetical protein
MGYADRPFSSSFQPHFRTIQCQFSTPMHEQAAVLIGRHSLLGQRTDCLPVSLSDLDICERVVRHNQMALFTE